MNQEAMEVESQPPLSPADQETSVSKHLKISLQLSSYAALALGIISVPLLLRIYYLHGGQRKWLNSWLQTVGFPLTLVPLAISYLHRRLKRQRYNLPPPKLLLSTPRVLAASAAIGLLMGLDDFLYAYGSSYLPVSTSSIILSTQLAFTAVFAFLIVRQRFTAFSVNAVALLIAGSVLLGLGASGDRPPGETTAKYYTGFFVMLTAAALYGLVMPLVELTYSKAGQSVSNILVLEVQLVIGLIATGFCTVGMIINHDFQAIKREAREFGLGEFKYYMLLSWTAILCEVILLGMVGSIFYGSALLAGVIVSVSIPITEVFAVIFLREPFSAQKGVALVLSLWGFASYLYGEYKKSRKKPIVVEPGDIDA